MQALKRRGFINQGSTLNLKPQTLKLVACPCSAGLGEAMLVAAEEPVPLSRQASDYWVYGLGFEVQGVGFRIEGLGQQPLCLTYAKLGKRKGL